jgi:carbamoyltransferase
MYILGLSAFYHDSAACLLLDGRIVAAAQEERFTRRRHDSGFPARSIEYCLASAGIPLSQIKYVVFYDKPLLKFDRLLETYLAFAPKGLPGFLKAMPVWLKDKLFLKKHLRRELAALGKMKEAELPKLLFPTHHQSHAASAFYPSPFEKAAVLCLDGVGEWATTTVWKGEGNQLTPVWEIRFPHSLGLLYAAFTYYTGFKVNSAEYKVMGLAPYGEPKYVDTIYKHLIDVKEDGTFRLNMSYFEYPVGLKMTNAKFDALFGGPPRKAETPLTQREMDLARSVQVVTEDIVLKLAHSVHKELEMDYLCLAGGVALNCVANGRLLREGPFKDIWVQPAAGDAGGALGAAYCAWHLFENKPRETTREDPMKGSYLGPSYRVVDVQRYLDEVGASYRFMGDTELNGIVAEILES